VRVVLDTNVFVSMVLGGHVGAINEYWKADKFILVVSDDIVSEYLDVLSRPKLHLTADLVSAVFARVQRKAEVVTPTKQFLAVDADPDDNKFLDAAIAAKADYVISGDAHLLDLKLFRAIPILTARAFIDLLSV